jgi:hypothetical protein
MVYTFDATECGTHGGRYVRPPRDRMLPESAFRQMFGNRGPTQIGFRFIASAVGVVHGLVKTAPM